ncbi:retrovirus-related pol polyprotein from transposon TNT 1-94 [Tanacetum coccineum]
MALSLGYQNSFYLKQAQQKQQSLYNGNVLLEKHDPPAVYDLEDTLQLAQESRSKMKQLNREIKPANYAKINHLSVVFVPQTAKSQEELYFSNASKTGSVSKLISVPNEELLDDVSPNVARKSLNEIAQPGMNMGQDRHIQNVRGNGGNQFGQYIVQNVGNQVVQNPGVQNVGNQNGLIVFMRIPHPNGNQNGTGNVNAARAEGTGYGYNDNQIRCYNCRGLGHYARNCTVRPRRRDAAYLQTQLLIAQKEEAKIQLQAEEYDLMSVAADIDEIEEVNANCILMANLQQASTSGIQTDKAPIYDSDGSAEVHCDNGYNNDDIFNMFTQEDQYYELREPIPESHLVQQNDSDVITAAPSVEQSGGIVEQHFATVEEIHAYYQSLYKNLAVEVKKVNMVNRNMKVTNAELTTELARCKNQEKCFEISQEKYNKLERCYQKSVYQEQCLTKKINALHLGSAKQTTTLNEEITNLNTQLSNEKSTISFLQEERKKLKSYFKKREDELLDKQILLENKIKGLENIRNRSLWK